MPIVTLSNWKMTQHRDSNAAKVVDARTRHSGVGACPVALDV